MENNNSNSIIRRAAKFILEYRKRKLRYKVISGFGMIVVFITVYMLILPAITAERKALCGIEEHTHKSSCYAKVDELICELSEDEEHSHDENCYNTYEELICGLDEHTHDEVCFSKENKDTKTALIGDPLEFGDDITLSEYYYDPFDRDKNISKKSRSASVDSSQKKTDTNDEKIYTVKRINDIVTSGEAVVIDENNDKAAGRPDVSADDITSGGLLIPDDLVSGSALDLGIVEEHSEEYVEALTETTTEAYVDDSISDEIAMLKADGITLCGLAEHEHSDMCYDESGVLICELEEHKHDNNCYSIMLLAESDVSSLIIAQGDSWKITLSANGSYTLTYDGSVIPENFVDLPELSKYLGNINKVYIKDSVEAIKVEAFAGFKSLETVEVEENNKLEYICDRAFKDCTKLNYIQLENFRKLKSLGAVASIFGGYNYERTEGEVFKNTALTVVTIPDSVKYINEFSFADCTELVTVHFEEQNNNDIFNICGGAFSGCTSLRNINLNDLRVKYVAFTQTLFNTELAKESNSKYGVFYNCKSLEKIDMPDKIINYLVHMFSGCSSLEKVTFHGSDGAMNACANGMIAGTKIQVLDISSLDFTTINDGFIDGCESLSSVILPDTLNDMSSQNVIINCPNLTSIKFGSDEGVVPAFSNIGVGTFKNNPALSEFGFTNLKGLTNIQTSAFEGCSSLEKVVLTSSLSNIYSYAFKNCSGLKEVVYTSYDLGKSTNVQKSIFVGAGKFKLTFTRNNGYYDTISKKENNAAASFPHELNIEFLSQALDHASSLKFDSNVAFYVGTEGEKTKLPAPFTDGGLYCTDDYGSLYKVHNDNTVELVYIQRENPNAIIPDSFDYILAERQGAGWWDIANFTVKETKGTVTVTSIAKDSFKDSDAVSVNIEKTKNIKNVDPYGFANAKKLARINDATTVGEATKIFTSVGAEVGDNAFFNTALGDQEDEKIFDSENPKKTTEGPLTLMNENNSNEALQIGFDTEDQQIDGNSGKYYTGTNAVFHSTISTVNDDAYYRVYVRMEEGCDVKLYEIIGSSDISYERHETDDPNIFYFEFQFNTGQTANIRLSVGYPNYTEPGKKVQVWGARVAESVHREQDGKVIDPATGSYDKDIYSTEEYFDLEWITYPIEYTLAKEGYGADLSFKATTGESADGEKFSALKGLQYKIDYIPQGELLDDMGYDLVSYVDYKDILTLPEGLRWRPGLDTSRSRYTLSGSGGTLYAYANDGNEYKICQVNSFGTITGMSLEYVGKDNYENEQYAVCWRVINDSIKTDDDGRQVGSEIGHTEGILTYGDDVIVAAGLTEDQKFEKQIHNDVSTETHYMFSDMKEAAASADVEITAGDGRIEVTKELLNDPDYMGEDIEYKITVTNPSAFSYYKMDKLEDRLSYSADVGNNTAQYIKPENMQALFDDLEDEESLTITISKAVLTEPVSGKVTTVDGVTEAELSARNTASVTQYDTLYTNTTVEDRTEHFDDAVITLTKSKEDSNITLVASYNNINKTLTIGKGGNFADIQSALDSLAYIVTAGDNYVLVWEYPENFEFVGGRVREYKITATAKTSLMNLNNDWHFWYSWPGPLNSEDNSTDIYNEAQMYLTDYESLSSDEIAKLSPKTEDIKAKVDLYITKTPYVKGQKVRGTGDNPEDPDLHSLQLGDVIDYEVLLHHYGNGTYDVLPIVDKMTGLQALLVSVAENQGADWTKNSDLRTYVDDGIQYYVLTEGEYEGVYVNGYYTDKITVTKNKTGLTTLLKFYLKDTASGEHDYIFRYKSIMSEEYTGVSIDDNDGSENLENGQFSVANEVWANDYPTHRIYAQTFGSATKVSFAKKILEKRGISPDFDNLNETDRSVIVKDDNVVKYRLEIYNPFERSAKITGKNFFDMLPATGETFSWSKANVSIEYAADEGVTVTKNGSSIDLNAMEWEVVSEKPDEGVKLSPSAGQQYIKWDNDVTITFSDGSPNSSLYIYVTLTFPGGEDEAAWQSFVKKVGDQTLTNVFYVFRLPDSVRHTVSDQGSVLLQKGVYEIGHYSKLNGGNYNDYYETYYRDVDRKHYSNNYPNGSDYYRVQNTVTYYVIIKNNGSSKLYLSPLYDVLPPGFTYLTMNVAAIGDLNLNNFRDRSYGVGSTVIKQNARMSHDICTFPAFQDMIAYPEGFDPTKITGTNSDNKQDAGNFVGCSVHIDNANIPTTADGRQRLKFTFDASYWTDGSGNGYWTDSDKINDSSKGSKSTLRDERHVHKDDYGVYLQSNEFICFAYTVATGNADINEAVNPVAMEYIAFSENETVEMDKETAVNVSDANGMYPNDGGRDVWNMEQIEKAGFLVDGETGSEFNKNPDRQWLVSDVTVVRGDYVPGITKSVAKNIVSNQDTVEWTVRSENNGTGALKGYTIKDTMEYPYKFEGDILYSVFNGTDAVTTPQNKLDSWSDKNEQARAGYFDSSSQKIIPLLFRIERVDGDNVKLIYYNHEGAKNEKNLRIGNTNPVTLTVNTFDASKGAWGATSWLGKYWGTSRLDIKVTITREKNAAGKDNEVLTINFSEPGWQIPAGGYSELKVSTKIPQDDDTIDSDDKYGLFPNNAKLLTPDGNYDENNVSAGYNMTDESGNNTGVENNSFVNAHTGAPSNAYKAIEEKGNADNNARSDKLPLRDNYITVDSKDKEVVYSLVVVNSNNSPMTKLAIIDNLPQIGDNNTVRASLKRDSEFTVGLSENPEFTVEIGTEKDGIFDNEYEILDPSKYTISVSRKDGTSVYTSNEWQGEMTDNTGATVWYKYDDKQIPNDEVRSIRVFIEDSSIIGANAVVRVRFNGRIQGEPEPSQIAWNNFGYRYEVQSGSGTLAATASPLNVGVCIPAAPQLQKVLVSKDGKESPLGWNEQDKEFHFVLYKGDAVSFGNEYTAESVGNKLSGRDMAYITLAVKAGEAKSDILSLVNGAFNKWTYSNGKFVEDKNSPWNWEDGATYNIVELQDFEDYSFRAANDYSDKRNYTFKYNNDENVEVVFENSKPDWNITVIKVSENYDKGSVLGGALIGIYSPNPLDQMSQSEFDALGVDDEHLTRVQRYYLSAVKDTWEKDSRLLENGKYGVYSPDEEQKMSEDELERFGISEEDSILDITYYLMQAKISPDSTGRIDWTELCEDSYLVYEIKAPDGYMTDKINHIYTRDDTYEGDDTVYDKIVNEPGEEMPSTGGRGIINMLRVTGLIVVLLATVIIVVRRRKNACAGR